MRTGQRKEKGRTVEVTHQAAKFELSDSVAPESHPGVRPHYHNAGNPNPTNTNPSPLLARFFRRKKKHAKLEAAVKSVGQERDSLAQLLSDLKTQNVRHGAAMSTEIRDLTADNSKVRQKYQSSKGEVLSVQAKLKESELKNEKAIRDLKHMATAVGDMEEQRKQQEYQVRGGG